MRSGASILVAWLTGLLLAGCNLPSAPTAATGTTSLPGRPDLELIAASIVVQINLDRDRIGLGHSRHLRSPDRHRLPPVG